ncbi:MAG: AI-2E family transporter [Lachnospiraceae bacterium]|jgi:predicted PurR-regulated permease PerM
MKKFRWDSNYLHWGVTAFLVIAASLLFYFGIFHMGQLLNGLSTIIDILMPVLCGLVIAYLLAPILNFLEKKVFFKLFEKNNRELTKGKKKVIRYCSVLLSLCFGASIIYALIAMIAPSIIESIISIINNFPYYLDNVEHWIEKLVESNPNLEDIAFIFFDRTSERIEDFLTQNVLPQMSNVLGHLSAGVFDILGFLWDIILGAIMSIYLLADKEKLIAQGKMFLYSCTDTESANHFIRNLRFVNNTFGGFISGKVIDSVIIGFLCYIGTSLIGTPYAILVSVVVGITNIIPFFGPYLGAIPSAFLILMVSPIQCLYFIIFILVLQQFDGNFLGPKILGGSTGISSLMVIIAILIFGGLMGIFGMIIGVPVTAVIWSIVTTRRDNRLRKRALPDDPEEYQEMDFVDLDTKRAVPYTKESIAEQKTYQMSPKKLRKENDKIENQQGKDDT